MKKLLILLSLGLLISTGCTKKDDPQPAPQNNSNNNSNTGAQKWNYTWDYIPSGSSNTASGSGCMTDAEMESLKNNINAFNIHRLGTC